MLVTGFQSYDPNTCTSTLLLRIRLPVCLQYKDRKYEAYFARKRGLTASETFQLNDGIPGRGEYSTIFICAFITINYNFDNTLEQYTRFLLFAISVALSQLILSYISLLMPTTADKFNFN